MRHERGTRVRLPDRRRRLGRLRAGGAAFARTRACSVALLEAGPADKSVLIHCPAGLAVLAKNGAANWAFETVPQAGLNGRRGYQPRGKVLGGSSSVNAMIYLRGQREDYDDWAAEGNAGWGWTRCCPTSSAPSTTSAAPTPGTAPAVRST